MEIKDLDSETLELILNSLREGTIRWHFRTEAMNHGRKLRFDGAYKNGKPKYVWENNCQECGKYFDLKAGMLEIDHIEEIGGFKGDFNVHILRMYCPRENLQRLCITCHRRKSSKYNATKRFERKLKEQPLPEAYDAL